MVLAPAREGETTRLEHRNSVSRHDVVPRTSGLSGGRRASRCLPVASFRLLALLALLDSLRHMSHEQVLMVSGQLHLRLHSRRRTQCGEDFGVMHSEVASGRAKSDSRYGARASRAA